MENILSMLGTLSSELQDTSSKRIATAILDNWLNGKILTQKELCELTHFSEGLITIFCQKLGFDGYYEFKTRLKNEYSKIFMPSLKSDTFQMSIEKMKDKSDVLLSDLYFNKKFFENFVAQLKERKKITIFSVHATYASSLYIAGLLNSKGYECKVLNSNENLEFDKKMLSKSEEMFLFFLIGIDTSLLFLLLKYFQDSDSLFLITTNGQKEKTKGHKNIFVINDFGQKGNYWYRTVSLQTIFLIIADQLEKL